MHGPQEGPPDPSLCIPFCHGKHGQRLLVNTYLVCIYPQQNEPEVEGAETRQMWGLGFFLVKELDRRVVAVELLHVTCSSVRKVLVEGIEQALLSKKPS